MKVKIAFLGLFVHFSAWVSAQSTFAPLNEDYYHRIDRYEVKAGKIYPQLFTNLKQYKRSDIVALMDSVEADGGFESRSDQFNIEYINNDNWEWGQPETADSKKPILKHFYKKKADFYSVHTKDFDLHVNPVIYVGLGQDSRLTDDNLFTNTRGIEVRGMVDEKVGFYTYLADNQTIMPSYVNEWRAEKGVVPHEGFWKTFKEGPGVDFLQARGYISFNATKHIDLQFGHDRFFVGNGQRSMVFSDFAPPGLFFKGNVKVWKLNYMFLLNRFVADPRGLVTGIERSSNYPNKIVAFHHLSMNIGKKFNIGVFESVIYSPDDTTRLGGFDMAYANPIIFYRAIEQQNGSSDNVLLGLDFKWNALRGVQLYGQLMLDEFLLDNVKEGNGWWANKVGVQAGLKYVDAFGVSNLDLQGEYNLVRPYTYSHNTQFGSYTNFRQAVAHPLEANFQELIGVIRYQPIPKLTCVAKAFVYNKGVDGTVDENWGGNLLKDNSTREKDYENTIGQGVPVDVVYGSFTASWMLKHNLFVDGTYIYRDSKSTAANYTNTTSVLSMAVRWNIAQRHYEF